MYSQLEVSKAALLANRAALSESEFAQQEAEIEAAKTRLKRRMLGNIRFVGELYKQGLLQTGTMHSCVMELLGCAADGWKEVREEQDIELLCRLLTTVGEVLESKSAASKDKGHLPLFNSYFERLGELSRDKSLNSRMRFTIEELLTLRVNNWQARRQQDGPLKISEIHQKIEEEERRQAMLQQQQQQHSYRPQNMGGGGPPMPRHMQQQQHMQHQQQFQQHQPPTMQIPKIMTRQSPGGRGGVSPATYSGRGGRGTPNSAGGGGLPISRTTSLGPGDARQVFNDIRHAGDGLPIRRLQSDPSSGGYPSSSSSAAAAAAVDFSDPAILKLASGMIREYLANNNDIEELRQRLSEANPALYVFLLLQITSQFVDTNSSALQQNLLQLLGDETLRAALVGMRGLVETALSSYEPLKLLADTTVDCKDVSAKQT